MTKIQTNQTTINVHPSCIQQVLRIEENIKKMKYVNGVYGPSHLAMQGNSKHIDHWKQHLL